MGRLMETTPQVFEETWRLHAFGAFLWARQVVPDARAGARNDSDHGRYRGHPPVADFGGLRAGEIRGARTGAGDVARSSSTGNPRGVCASMAASMPLLRKLRPEAKEENLLKPAAIADAFWYLAHQDRSVWSHELDVRPFTEKF